MQTTLSDSFKHSADGQIAEGILRNCVHCGFCLATCPSYQILGNELDSPRGRIYLIKQLVEGHDVSAKTQLHLDRCLTCRNCETTCPSGVEYGKLLDIGRALVDAQVPRGPVDTAQRALLSQVIPRRRVFTALLRIGQMLRPLLPRTLKNHIPQSVPHASRVAARVHSRKMLLLEGCAQPALAPNINAAATRVLDRLGISLYSVAEAGCCGAVSFHLNDHARGLDAMRRNIDAWLPQLDAGAEAIVTTASGCGVTVKDYAWHLRDDPVYAARATRISAATRDLSEILAEAGETLNTLANMTRTRVAFHPPCTLQHGQQINGIVETLLTRAGFALTPVAEPHLCCGSAGTYSILQPAIAQALQTRKLHHLQAGAPEVIVTANIGCLTHLQAGTTTPVRHWIELLDEDQGGHRPKMAG